MTNYFVQNLTLVTELVNVDKMLPYDRVHDNYDKEYPFELKTFEMLKCMFLDQANQMLDA